MYWGRQDEQSAIRAVNAAIDEGVNWIDTAPFYGWGRAEETVGKAVKGRRDDVYIFTKCGTLPDGKEGSLEDLRPGTVRREVEASLRRLQTDHVDLLQFHDPDPSVPIEESWSVIQELIRDGKVRHGGLSNHPVDLLQRAIRIFPVTSNQLQYNPLERKIEEEMMPFCQANNIGILGWGSLAEGFLADSFNLGELAPGDFRRRHRYGQPDNYEKILAIKRMLRPLAEKRGKRLVDLVIAWELMHPALTGAIVGIRNEKEAKEMVGGLDWRLGEEEVKIVEDALAFWKSDA